MVALLAVVLGYYVVDGHNGLSVYRQKRIENRDLAQQIEQLNQENARLKDHVDRLNNDPDAIEHEAREKLHYSRPGEVILHAERCVPIRRKVRRACNSISETQIARLPVIPAAI